MRNVQGRSARGSAEEGAAGPAGAQGAQAARVRERPHDSLAQKAWRHQHLRSRELWEGAGNLRSFLEGERGEQVQESMVSLPRKTDSPAFSAGAWGG